MSTPFVCSIVREPPHTEEETVLLLYSLKDVASGTFVRGVDGEVLCFDLWRLAEQARLAAPNASALLVVANGIDWSRSVDSVLERHPPPPPSPSSSASPSARGVSTTRPEKQSVTALVPDPTRTSTEMSATTTMSIKTAPARKPSSKRPRRASSTAPSPDAAGAELS
jgi:hypothetical protein